MELDSTLRILVRMLWDQLTLLQKSEASPALFDFFQWNILAFDCTD